LPVQFTIFVFLEHLYYCTFEYFFYVFWSKISVAKTIEKQHPRIEKAMSDFAMYIYYGLKSSALRCN